MKSDNIKFNYWKKNTKTRIKNAFWNYLPFNRVNNN